MYTALFFIHHLSLKIHQSPPDTDVVGSWLCKHFTIVAFQGVSHSACLVCFYDPESKRWFSVLEFLFSGTLLNDSVILSESKCNPSNLLKILCILLFYTY